MAEDPDRALAARREGRRLRIPTPADLRHPRQEPEPPDQVAGPPPEAGASIGQDQVPPGPPLVLHAADPPIAAVPVTVTPGTLPRPHSASNPPTHAVIIEPPAGAVAAKASQPAPDPSTQDKARSAGEAGGRRLFPNPASLMAAGRGARKVRPGFRGRRLPRVEETSAGGVVLDLTAQPPAVALIARHDRRARLLWSLPKGHVEEGETPEQAALREVNEETGLVGRIVAPLGVIDFWFIVEDKRIHKTVHHYVIEAVGGELSDEDIEVEAVEWVPFDQVSRRLAYGDERRLVEKVAAIVPGVR